MTRKRADAPSPSRSSSSLKGGRLKGKPVRTPTPHDPSQPLSLKDRRRPGRVSGRQRRSEQTLLEEFDELLPDQIVDHEEPSSGQAASPHAESQASPPSPPPASPTPAKAFPSLGNPTPAGLPIPQIIVDAQVDVLEQNTETAKKMLTYDTAIDANPILQPPPLPEEADDTAVDVRMDADFMKQLAALKAQSRGETPAPSAASSGEYETLEVSEDSPETIWTSDFGSSPELPKLRPERPSSASETTYDEEVESLNEPQKEATPKPPPSARRRALETLKRDTEETQSLGALREQTPASSQAAPSLRPSSLRSQSTNGVQLGGSSASPAVMSTMDIKAPKASPNQEDLLEVPRDKSLEDAIHNRQVLDAFLEQKQFVYMLFNDAGRLSLAQSSSRNEAADQLFAFPTFDQSDKGRLISMSVPVGFVKDDMGGLCESHLVLAKARRSAPLWSLAVAELQATSVKTLQFKKWLSASPDDLAQLNRAQQRQLHLLLDEEQFQRLLHNQASSDELPQARSKGPNTADLPSLTDEDIIDTNASRKRPSLPEPARRQQEPPSPSRSKASQAPPSQPPGRMPRQLERIPSKIVHPTLAELHVENGPGPTNPLAPSHPKKKKKQPPIATSKEAQATPLPARKDDGVRPHTLAADNFKIPMVSGNKVNRDDTAMRRIKVDTAPLDPQNLRLHVKIPRKFAGRWFKGSEETLSIYGSHREIKLPQLGILLQFTCSQSAQGKVYPQVAITRSTNVKGVTYAQHDIEIYANRNPQSEAGWDHVQQLLRGHVAQIDLSPTDQLRGVLELYVQHPEHGVVAEPIHASWSVLE